MQLTRQQFICGGLALRFRMWMSSDLHELFIKNRQYLKLATGSTTALKQWPYSSKEWVSWWFITAVTVAVIAAAVTCQIDQVSFPHRLQFCGWVSFMSIRLPGINKRIESQLIYALSGIRPAVRPASGKVDSTTVINVFSSSRFSGHEKNVRITSQSVSISSTALQKYFFREIPIYDIKLPAIRFHFSYQAGQLNYDSGTCKAE